MKNVKTLHEAKKNKNDEFYTLFEDIDKECSNYASQFKDKVIYCNCDDPFESNFFRYFASNFKYFGLKKLICTCYDKGSNAKPIDLWYNTYTNDLGIEVSPKRAYKIILTDAIDFNKDGIYNWDDVTSLLKNDIEKEEYKYITYLDEDGDFRSKECIELLKESDIVVTNPPFSLFREFIALMEKYKKKYLLLGNMNALSYRETFSLIKQNKLWTGYGFNVSMIFKTSYKNTNEKNRKFVISKGYDPDDGYIKVPAICWYTNLDTYIRHSKIDLYKKYNAQEFPKYDNYDAIEVEQVDYIPEDYFGVMGVPITFIGKYNADQFQILGLSAFKSYDENLVGIPLERYKDARCIINEQPLYARVFIKRRESNVSNNT